MRVKKTIKKIIPDFLINLLHLFYAWWGAMKYVHPSDQMLIIGVTGTSGKSSTVHFLRQILEDVGYTVGSLSTADFYVDGEQKLNDRKMTMLGHGKIHKYLREMQEQDCDIAILETTSEGALQHRHRFINYDYIIFTNLYREHIEAHGGFDNYKQCKLDILDYVSRCKPKYLCGKGQNKYISIHNKANEECDKVPKTCFVSGNNEHTVEGLKLNFDKKCVFAREDKKIAELNRDNIDDMLVAENNETDKLGISFEVEGLDFEANVFGKHNIWNILAALSVVKTLGYELKQLQYSVENLSSPPGRLEFIEEAEDHNFKAIVDYAFEPEAIKALYKVVGMFEANKIIHVCGSAGGGRDKSRRSPIGKLAAENSDIVIVTNEDPYDEDPMQIIDQVADGAEEIISEDKLYKIKSREEAIEKAISLAEEDDIVLVTGKGSEQGIIESGEFINWDDREVVREKINKIYELR